LIIVDTSVWIDFLNGIDSEQRKILHDLIEKNETIFLSSIILLEILQGIKNDVQNHKVKNYLLAFPFIEPNAPKSYIFASEIYRKCRKIGITIRSPIDTIIAQIAIENNLKLLHRDRDYDNIASVINNLKLF